MNSVVLQSGISPPVVAAVTAVFVTALLGALATSLRYVFDVQLMTSDEVDAKIADANAIRQDDFDAIIDRLDTHSKQLNRLEDLVLGGEYQISDGMLELVGVNAADIDNHEDRIEGVERIQLKIRRRQRERSGNDPVVDAEDVNPPPNDVDRGDE